MPGKTKRAILSKIAKFFDPLGWITPVIITAKIFIQDLWLLKCQWDDKILANYSNRWSKFYAKLPCLNALQIPRWTKQGSDAQHCTLHGFSDASNKAYAAAVYLRAAHIDGSVTVSLLIAKAKVAPLKTLSVPRLELSAAHLLARLLQFVRTALQLQNMECHC